MTSSDCMEVKLRLERLALSRLRPASVEQPRPINSGLRRAKPPPSSPQGGASESRRSGDRSVRDYGAPGLPSPIRWERETRTDVA
jgi:hypothetical protein